MANKIVKSIYGLLDFHDENLGTQGDIQLEGDMPEKFFTPDDIKDFGTWDLGDEANIYVTFEDESTLLLNDLEDIKNFFRQYGY